MLSIKKLSLKIIPATLFLFSLSSFGANLICYYGDSSESGDYGKMPIIKGQLFFTEDGPVAEANGKISKGDQRSGPNAYRFEVNDVDGAPAMLSIQFVNQIGNGIAIDAVINGEQAFCL